MRVNETAVRELASTNSSITSLRSSSIPKIEFDMRRKGGVVAEIGVRCRVLVSGFGQAEPATAVLAEGDCHDTYISDIQAYRHTHGLYHSPTAYSHLNGLGRKRGKTSGTICHPHPGLRIAL